MNSLGQGSDVIERLIELTSDLQNYKSIHEFAQYLSPIHSPTTYFAKRLSGFVRALNS